MEVLIESTGVQPREGFRLSVSTRNEATGAPRSRLHGGQESEEEKWESPETFTRNEHRI
jgi:hypothetical protein